MDSTGPWWSTPVFTLAGVLLTLLVTVWLDHRRGRRESRHRWTERKMELYSEFLATCDDLRDIDVWPPEQAMEPSPTGPLFVRVRRAAQRAAYTAPAEVNARLKDATAAAEMLAATIEDVRNTTKRGHAGGVDARVRSRVDAAVERFDTTVDEFVAASRKDVDVGDRIS